MNLYESLVSRHDAARTAVRCDDGRSWSYGEVDQLAARTAGYLLSLGAEAGDRIALQAPRCVETLWFYLGCLRAGLVYLPLNTAYTRDEVGYFLADARPRLVICEPERVAVTDELLADAVGRNKSSVLSLDGKGGGSAMAAFQGERVPDAAICNCKREVPATILYTSGTTGRPKGAMLSHGNLLANQLALCEAWEWHEDDVMLHALPLFHVHGLFLGVNLPLLAGAQLHLLPGFDPAGVVARLPDATVFMGVPTHYTRLLKQAELTAAPCRNMRLFISGSAPLSVQTFEAFQARTGHRILERYGMTETGMNITNPCRGPRKAGTVGRPLAGVECRIVDEQGDEVAAGATGLLEVRGENVFTGYWGIPRETAGAFAADGFFRTGDLARCDADGYFTLVGRSKDLIITGGLNVYPGEVEAVIEQLPEVAEAAVIGVPHPDFGEAVTAVVVPASDVSETELKERLLALTRDRLANFKQPKQIHLTAELPRNTLGKVLKARLREAYANDHAE